jgi:hypothetical protein
MLIAFAELKTYRIVSPKRDIGRMADIAFPRGQWFTRYLIAWSDELDREVALPASRVRQIDRDAHTLHAAVDLDRVEASPRWDLTRRIERHEEQQLYEHYGWPPYWLREEHDVTPIGALSGESERMEGPDESQFEHSEMQLATRFMGAFAVHANEGEFGVLQDIVLDDTTWMIPYLAVDAPAQEGFFLVDTGHVARLDWVAKEVYISLPAATLIAGPAYTSPERLTPELDRALHEYYERIAAAR